MTDNPAAPARGPEPASGDSLDRWGPTAIVSYVNLFIFTLTGGGVFWLVANQIPISAVMAGILGAILGAAGNGAATTSQFWLGGNVGAKATTKALASLAATPSSGVSAPSSGPQTINLVAQDPAAPPAPPDQDLDIPPAPGAAR